MLLQWRSQAALAPAKQHSPPVYLGENAHQKRRSVQEKPRSACSCPDKRNGAKYGALKFRALLSKDEECNSENGVTRTT